MIKIKHKQTGETKWVTVYEIDQKLNIELWIVLKEQEIVQLYDFVKGSWRKLHRMEKQDAIKLIEENPNTYKFENLSSSDIFENILIKPFRQKKNAAKIFSKISDEDKFSNL